MTSRWQESFPPWPDDVASRYRARGYWQGRPLGDWLEDRARASSDAVALVSNDMTLTYAEMMHRADAAAVRLERLGLRPGDRIVVQLPNSWEFVVLLIACLRLGVVPVMALPAHRRHELSHFVAKAEATAIAVPGTWRTFDHQALAHEIARDQPTLRLVLVAADDVDERSVDLRDVCTPPGDAEAVAADLRARAPTSDTVALFLLSGGTTGLPKLIPRTHDDYCYNARQSAAVCGFGADTVYLVVLPIGHNFPLASPGILGTLLHGGRAVLLPTPEPAQAFAAIAEHGVTVSAVVPAVASRWLEHRRDDPRTDLTSLRVLQVGGARLAPELARRVRPTLGCTLQQVFGMAEGLLNYTRLDDPDVVVCETQGRPISPDDEIRIVDEHDSPVPDGTPGALLTRGPYTLRGYFRDPEHNARAFTADGWYRTGDVVRLHHSGNLVVEGREKDLINRGGEKISAEEVEDAAYRLPGVAMAAAVAMPDRELGERVCLFVTLRPDGEVTLDAVRARMEQDGFARFKLPERLVVRESLPTTNVGKIDKAALRADAAALVAGSTTQRPA